MGIKYTKAIIKPDQLEKAYRIRKDLGNLDQLGMSIHRIGLLNPPTFIELKSGKFRLIAGERRTTTCLEKLGWAELEVRIPCEKNGVKVTKENAEELITPDDLIEIEFEENAKRKDLTYDEQVTAVKLYHELMVKKMGQGKEGKKTGWSMRDTAAAMGVSVGTISGDIKLAAALEKNPELATKKNKSAALVQIKREEEKAAHEAIFEAAEKTGFTPDCLHLGKSEEVMKTFPSKSVDCLFMDPPYAVNYDKGEGQEERWDGYLDVPDVPHAVFENLSLVVREARRVLKDDAQVFCFFHMSHYSAVRTVLIEAGFQVNPVPLFWVKDRHGGGTSPYIWSNAVEPCFHAWQGKPTLKKQGVKNYFVVPGVPGAARIHPTEKPLRLIMSILENATEVGAVILDPYAGSGSTLRAAFACDREGIGIEMKEEHYKAAVAALLKQQVKGSTRKSLKKSEIDDEESF